MTRKSPSNSEPTPPFYQICRELVHSIEFVVNLDSCEVPSFPVTNGLNAAILGATGAVGEELIKLLEQGTLPINSLTLLASARSAGKTLSFKGSLIPVQTATPEALESVDVAFFSAGASRSREFSIPAIEAGAVVIDNSSAFRMSPDVPLVVSGVNDEAICPHHRLIANPNCTAMIMLMAVAPLRKFGNIKRIILSTYQSASGAGAQAMAELEEQTRDVLAGKPAVPRVFSHPYAFNLFSHNTPIGEDGFNDEERKVIEETRKILDQPELGMNVTCVRVPVLRAHSESITVEFDGPSPDPEGVKQLLSESSGVRVVDDPETNTYPMPLTASGIHEVLVGRIRRDLSNPNALCLFVSGDQLLKGAALNAVQIAQTMLAKGYLGAESNCRSSAANP